MEENRDMNTINVSEEVDNAANVQNRQPVDTPETKPEPAVEAKAAPVKKRSPRAAVSDKKAQLTQRRQTADTARREKKQKRQETLQKSKEERQQELERRKAQLVHTTAQMNDKLRQMLDTEIKAMKQM